MKIYILILLCFISLTQARKTDLSRKLKNKSKIVTPIEELAKIAHSMVYDAKETDYLNESSVIEESSFKVSYGLLKSNPTVAVVVFRGTVITEPKNIFADLDIRLTDLTPVEGLDCTGCQVHNGFYQAFGKLQQKIFAQLAQFLKKKIDSNAVTEVNFTGHSLGGALATIGCYELSNWLKTVKVGIVTFGAPRVGNAAFKKVFDTKLNLKINARITYNKDPVPTVPFTDKFAHCGTEYNFADKDNFTGKNYLKDETLSAPTTTSALKEFANASDHSQYKTITEAKIKEVIQDNHTHIVSDMVKRK